jgi:hypothetical protein
MSRPSSTPEAFPADDITVKGVAVFAGLNIVPATFPV